MSPEVEQVLRAQDIIETIQKSRYNISAVNDEFVAEQMALDSYKHLNTAMPGKWAVATTPDIQNSLSQGGIDTVVISLIRCLPAPMPGTKAHEILEFRSRHADKLARLHNLLDNLILNISNSTDCVYALRTYSKDLIYTIDDIKGCMQASKIRFWPASLEIGVSVPQGIIAGIVAALGAPLGIAAAVANTLTIGIKRTRIPHGGNATPRKYEYVVQGLREGILQSDPSLSNKLDYDIKNVQITKSMVNSFYPDDISTPSKMSDSVFNSIFIM